MALLAGIAERGRRGRVRTPQPWRPFRPQTALRSEARCWTDQGFGSATNSSRHVRDTKGIDVRARTIILRHDLSLVSTWGDLQRRRAARCSRVRPLRARHTWTRSDLRGRRPFDGDAEALRPRGCRWRLPGRRAARQSLSVARGVDRPGLLGVGKAERFFASPELALEVVERYLGMK